MAEIFSRFTFPDYVYHGTVREYLNGYKDKLINKENLQHSFNKDFGTGLYTTIDFQQAADWARKLSNDLALSDNFFGDDTPLVIVIKVEPDNYDGVVDVMDFRGESSAWSNFILKHRFKSSLDFDPCGDIHPQVVSGSMADNDTGEVIKTFRTNGYRIDFVHDQLWFQNQIVYKQKHKRVLAGLELGDQIAFFDERLNDMLKLVGYCTGNDDNNTNNLEDTYWKGWMYHVYNGKSESVR
ncbi:DUF3990 domain-containing protein [Paenibacillus periandrae]|uniref:DUF3990 domain-containing protein n=1 Tax=Paenibacillus periandrae TaxID=1761741 RepID=UPI001F09D1CB|nr:DUF3990 domain-containing protein [Paenibacillus periandrae]